VSAASARRSRAIPRLPQRLRGHQAASSRSRPESALPCPSRKSSPSMPERSFVVYSGKEPDRMYVSISSMFVTLETDWGFGER
jgi:hypothetical protein